MTSTGWIVTPSGIRINETQAKLARELVREMGLARAQSVLNSITTLPGSTLEFAKQIRKFSHKPPWFHEIWYAAYDDPEIDRIYTQGPREHAKTSTVLTYAEHQLAKNHHLRVGILSGDDLLAMKFLGELKHEFEANELLRERYNGGRSWIGDKWTEHELVLADARDGPDGISGKDVSVFSVGQGSQISSRHCDLLIVDDVESAKTVKSDLVREGTRQWWAREVAPVLSPGGKMIVVGTRKHFDDLYSHLIAGDLDPEGEEGRIWKIIDDAKSVYLPTGEPIWPEFWDADRLAKRKAELDATDVMAWPQEYLNEPRPATTQMFYPNLWPTYDSAPWGLTIIQAWDLAISEKTTADFTVGFTIGMDEQNTCFLLEERRGHWDFNRTLHEIADMGNAWNRPDSSGTLAAIGIEDVAYQAAAVQEAIRRSMLPIVPVPTDKDKVTRARLLEARAAAGKVLRPVDAKWWTEFAREALYFPDGAHNDQVDALAHALRLAGWQADSITWQYGVWKCRNCGRPFMWEANRPCPQCGTKAPATYDNPELLSMGEMGSIASSAGKTTSVVIGDDGAPQSLLRIDYLYDHIEMGNSIPDPRLDDVDLLQELARKYLETNQSRKAGVALAEATKALKSKV